MALKRLYKVSTPYEVWTIKPKVENPTSMLKKNDIKSRCLTRTSANSKYFLWSQRLRVNEFQLYYDTENVQRTELNEQEVWNTDYTQLNPSIN